MQRREVLALLGGAAALSSGIGLRDTRAQQPAMPVIGILDGGGEQLNLSVSAAFRRGLGDMGYVEGRNVAIELRGSEHYDQLAAMAAELVRLRVAVIYAAGTSNTALAAKAATATIPIVFTNGSDPVQLGIVASMNRPGGNVTGVSLLAGELGPKRLEILRELVPAATTITFLVNPANARADIDISEMRAAAQSVGQSITIARATTDSEIDAAFALAAQQRTGALLVVGDAFFIRRRDQITALAARYRIPASYPVRDFAEAGGLVSYGDDRNESRRQAGLYVGRILKGEKPADLPVLQPVKFDFVINLKAAKALGIEFPPSFHLRATEVIE
jgi:putative tryptophan/tyrosine transport system substrate-binding protein